MNGRFHESGFSVRANPQECEVLFRIMAAGDDARLMEIGARLFAIPSELNAEGSFAKWE